MEESIIRVLQGHAGPEEVARVRAWREESPENAGIYWEIARVWTDLEDVEVDTTPPPVSLIRSRAGRIVPLPARSMGRRGVGAWAGTLAVAASLALFALRADILAPFIATDEPSLQMQELVTGPSETRMAQLSDGTTVFLAPNSRLIVRPTPGVRETWLEGRAFFGVARHGQDWPFQVRTARGVVHVLGTRFEVATEEDNLRLVVVDGTVDLATGGDKVQLHGGEMSLARSDSVAVVVQVEDVEELLEWMGGSLVFENTPLSRAAREIESRYGGTIELQGEDLGRRTISGGFTDRSFEEIISIICRVTSTECSVEGTHAVISEGILPSRQ